MITIVNDGPALRDTNYWDSAEADQGLFYLSYNAGAARLLVPDAMTPDLDEMATANTVFVTQTHLGRAPITELLFDDGTTMPYVIAMETRLTDRKLPDTDAGKPFEFHVYAREGLMLRLTAELTLGDRLIDTGL